MIANRENEEQDEGLKDASSEMWISYEFLPLGCLHLDSVVGVHVCRIFTHCTWDDKIRKSLIQAA